MEFGTILNRETNSTGAGTASDCGYMYTAVMAADVDSMNAPQLEELLVEAGRLSARLEAKKARAVHALHRLQGETSTTRALTHTLGQSKAQARRDVSLAVQTAELPEALDAMAQGDISREHVQLLATVAARSEIDTAAMTQAACEQSVDEFRATLRDHERDLAGDDGQALLDRQREQRSAAVFQGDDQMMVLHAKFDPVTGMRVATALESAANKLWLKEDPKNRRTAKQRYADALSALIARQPAGDGEEEDIAQPTSLLVIADYDTVDKKLVNARLADGTPLPASELVDLACDADILPAVFRQTGAERTMAQPLWMGRTRRSATHQQRAVLTVRDEGCIGCGTMPAWCQAHHVQWWSRGGRTDIDNLVLVCTSCHHDIHDKGWTVEKTPEGGYTLKEPRDPPDSPGPFDDP